MNKIIYYTIEFSYNSLPKIFFKWKYKKLIKSEAKFDQKEITDRLNYYFKVNNSFDIPPHILTLKDYKRNKKTGYFLDLKEFLHYFRSETKFAYNFGDSTKINDYPTIYKARPINRKNKNSILFKLNKKRHFYWVKDKLNFLEKKDILVWRGGAYQKNRKSFVSKFWNHPLCNVGQTNKPKENKPWQKEFLTIYRQLDYKFIFCIEGNDVATNLKWVMSSNSLCFMPKPKYETWFMEGTLIPNIHFVEIRDDYQDLEEKIKYYSKNTNEAVKIISNAHDHVKKFQNPNLENLLCLKVLEKYVQLSKQKNMIHFEK